MSTQFLTSSDVSAAIVGAGFSSVYGMGTPMMFAVKTIIISVAARLSSTSTMMSGEALGMDPSQKNQLIVAVLNAIDSYARSKNQSVLKAVLSGVSIDLIGQEVLKLTRMEDKVLIGGSA
jgi:hypothetical protein